MFVEKKEDGSLSHNHSHDRSILSKINTREKFLTFAGHLSHICDTELLVMGTVVTNT